MWVELTAAWRSARSSASALLRKQLRHRVGVGHDATDTDADDRESPPTSPPVTIGLAGNSSSGSVVASVVDDLVELAASASSCFERSKRGRRGGTKCRLYGLRIRSVIPEFAPSLRC